MRHKTTPSSCPTFRPSCTRKAACVMSLGPVHAIRRQRADGLRHRADLARHARAGSAHRRRRCVNGVRLTDQGVDSEGNPEATFLPGMDVRAALTVVGDGPVGAVGRQLDEDFGLPAGHHQREWAVGMKMVVDLPEDTPPRARHGLPHLRLSRAGDLRLPVRASRPRRYGRNLRAFLVPQSRAHLLPLPAALHAASVSLALSPGRQTALLGRQVAAGIRQARRAVPGRRRATRASAKAPAAPTCSPVVGRGRSLDHRRPARRSRARIAQSGQAAHQGKPRSALT